MEGYPGAAQIIEQLVNAIFLDAIDEDVMRSMLMFEPSYTRVLIEVGESDVEARLDELRDFLAAPEARAAAR